MLTFHLQVAESSRETMAVIQGCRELGYNWTSGGKPSAKAIPVGDVPFVQDVLETVHKYDVRPDYYPLFLADWFGRRIYRDLLEAREAPGGLFVKDQWRYKGMKPTLCYPDCLPRSMGFVASDVVCFTQEWRYYVAGGEVYTTGWYDGDDEDEPAPPLNVNWPKGWCGAVDFGRTTDGRVLLVESQHPFACGWYGETEDSWIYTEWLQLGWRWMTGRSFSSLIDPSSPSLLSSPA